MRICSPGEVESYLRSRKREFAVEVEQVEQNLADAKQAAKSYATQADALMAALSY